MIEKQQIQNIVLKKNIGDRIRYRTRLTTSVDCIRFLIRQGLAFRGHNEFEDSSNQYNFLELLNFLADHNEEVRVVALKNAPENIRLTSPKIQKDIVNVCAIETINVIIRDMRDAVFSILVDESRDVSIKEQMVVMFHYVDKKGYVIESFIGIEHVANTTTVSLKTTIDKLFSKHRLSISRLRGQGYDGTSNMSGEFNGLKTIIMKENECAFFVYCFAHQLQLALMGVAKKHGLIGTFSTIHYPLILISYTIFLFNDLCFFNETIGTFFTIVSNLVNIVGVSSKHEVSDFCVEQNIDVLNMENMYYGQGKSRRKASKLTNMHYCHVDFFNPMIDLQLQELNSHFNEANTELLLCLVCLSPNNSFSAFDKRKLICLAQLYSYDFFTMDLRRLVETRKHEVYSLVYLLIKLALTLPVATASIEMVFSAINIVKDQMRNKMRDQWLNDYLFILFIISTTLTVRESKEESKNILKYYYSGYK
ncbi:hypothetical protein UlMin_000775 [Ulmus minor]